MSKDPIEADDNTPMRVVFISFATPDKVVADAICAALENSGISCWIAPRDIVPGTTWPEAIMNAIEQTSIMVIVVSEHSNNSPQVLREVSQGVHFQSAIIPFRIADVVLSKDFKYFFSTPHWLDALTPPLEQHIEKLVQSVSALTSGMKTKPPSWASKPAKNTLHPAIQLESEGDVRLDEIFKKRTKFKFWSWLNTILDDK